MSKILISGSVAYDHIISTAQQFTDVILPDHLATLSAGFLADTVTVEDGGTAHNIAYNLGLLGCKKDTIMLATVGHDFRISAHLQQYISYDDVHIKQALRTPTAYISTDANKRQITFFYPGALSCASEQEVKDVGSADRVIIAPNDKEAMLQHAEQAYALGAKVLFDPGQVLPLFNNTDITTVAKYSDIILLNEYEYELIKKITQRTDTDIVAIFDKVVITKGKDGVVCRNKTQDIHIHGCLVPDAVDPTGAGDALRAGLLAGLIRTGDWTTALRLGNVMGSFAVEQSGTMHHRPSMQDIQDRFTQTYDAPLSL